jgi:hypothetical protein
MENPMKALAPILAATLLVAGTAASAQSAPDAQCLILSTVFAKQAKDAQSQQAAQVSVYFYMGRVRDGITAAQLKALFDTAAKGITDANAGQKMSDCLKAVQAKGDLLQSLSPPPPAAAAQPAQPKPQPQPQGR